MRADATESMGSASRISASGSHSGRKPPRRMVSTRAVYSYGAVGGLEAREGHKRTEDVGGTIDLARGNS